MKVTKWLPLLAMSLSPATYGAAIDTLLQEYLSQGATLFDGERGARLWNQSFTHDKPPSPRRCPSCHTEDPRQGGKHARTGKAISPLAPSVDAKRLSDVAKIRKWLKRNCEWTLGRECTAQEKGDLLTYLRNR